MKKLKVIALAVIIVLLTTFTFACKSEDESFLPLFDENGVYSEQNFAHNMALSKDGGICLFSGGTTEFTIVYSANATELEKTAVTFLAEALHKISGAAFAVKIDTEFAVGSHEICVGHTNRAFSPSVAMDDISSYVVATQNESLYLYGNTEYGTSNAVYGFLEDYMGCMFVDAQSNYFPSLEKAVLAPMNDLYKPAFEYRDVDAVEVDRDAAFARRLRLTGTEVFSSDGCHHSLEYVPSSQYFDSHPEYYALLGGSRRADTYMFQGPQLCWSNSEVVELVKQGVLKRIHDYEAAGGTREIYWDISQNDSMNNCTCSECIALNAEVGSGAGALLSAVNQIAKSLPQYKFSTLAYHYGSSVPTNFVPADNLMIKYCFMAEYGANDISKPISHATSDIGKKQYEEITGWSKLSDKIYIWDYITDYFYYQLPFPCLHSMMGNTKLLADLNVLGVYSLSAYNARGAGDYVKTYLQAHLLWNPYIDADALLNKYWTVYYGEGGRYVKQMYQRMEELVEGELWVYDFPFNHNEDYLSQSAVTEYCTLLDAAFAAVGGNETYAKRLRYEKLSLLYTKLVLNYDKDTRPKQKEEFSALCEEFSVTHLNEVGSSTVADVIGTP